MPAMYEFAGDDIRYEQTCNVERRKYEKNGGMCLLLPIHGKASCFVQAGNRDRRGIEYSLSQRDALCNG